MSLVSQITAALQAVGAEVKLKAPKASPALTGTPTAPTAAAGTNSTQIATTAYADAKVADAINDGTTGVAPSQNAVFDALAGKQPLDSDLTTIAGLTATTDNFLVAVASAWASRTPAQVRTTLGLVIGTHVQAWAAALDTWATKTAPSGTVLGTTDTQTVSGKRITRRATTTSGPGATPTINTDTTDYAELTGLATAITSMTTNLSGTPVRGDMLTISFTDNGTARAITWGTSFEASTVALPTTTVISTRLDVVFTWNVATSKWRVVGVA